VLSLRAGRFTWSHTSRGCRYARSSARASLVGSCTLPGKTGDKTIVAPELEADIPFADLPAPRRRSHQDGKSGAEAFIPTPPKLRASHEFPY